MFFAKICAMMQQESFMAEPQRKRSHVRNQAVGDSSAAKSTGCQGRFDGWARMAFVAERVGAHHSSSSSSYKEGVISSKKRVYSINTLTVRMRRKMRTSRTRRTRRKKRYIQFHFISLSSEQHPIQATKDKDKFRKDQLLIKKAIELGRFIHLNHNPFI